MTKQSDDRGTSAPTAERAQELFNLINSYHVTQMIHVAAKLGIADLLKNGPRDADTLAGATGTDAPSLYRLLRALAGFGIFAEDTQGRFELTPLAELLQKDVPGSQYATALYHGEESAWRALGELEYSVTTGKPAFRHLYGMDPWEHRAQNPELAANFDAFMVANTRRHTAAVVAGYDFSGIGTLVDVGGGQGALIAAILGANPQMRGVLCDEPHVVSGARPLLEAAGVSDRCETLACDFFVSVPKGGDAYILKSIIHDWDDEHAAAILRSCREAMPGHGKLLLVENLIPPGNGFHPGKMLDIQMLVMLGGRERTEAEYRALFTGAGFRLTRIIPTQSNFGFIEGVPV